MASGVIKRNVTFITSRETVTTQTNGAFGTQANANNTRIPIGFKVVSAPSGVNEVGGYFLKGGDSRYYLMTCNSNGSPLSDKQLTLDIIYALLP